MKAEAIRKLVITCMLGVVVGLTVILVVRNRDGILQFPWRIHLGYLGLALIFHSLALWTTFWVWHLMIKKFSGYGNLRTNIRFYYVSTLAKRIPTSLPYIGGRLFLYGQVYVSSAVVLNCILLENLLIGVAGIFVFIVFLPIYSISISTNVKYGLILVEGVFLLGLLLRSSFAVDFVNWILRRLGKATLNKLPTRQELFAWIGLYVLPWLFAAFSLYFALHGFSDHIALHMQDALAISTLATLVTLLNFILPTGLGLKELAMAALLSPWMPLSVALVVSLLYRLLHTFNEIFWAGMVLLLPIETEGTPVKRQRRV